MESMLVYTQSLTFLLIQEMRVLIASFISYYVTEIRSLYNTIKL